MLKNCCLLLLVLGTAGMAHAGTPIEDRDAFETRYLDCFESGNVHKCLEDTIVDSFRPGMEAHAGRSISGISSLFVQWLADDKVYTIHPLQRNKLGEFFEERSYMIEDTTGALMLLDVAFMNTRGAWYLHRFRISSKPETMEAVLGVKL